MDGGEVIRTKEQCDGGRTQLTEEEAKKSGAMAFRRAAPNQDLTLYGRSPVFELGRAGQLVIERLDKSGERIVLDMRPDQLLHRAFFDSSKSNILLAAGGRYQVPHAERQLVFRIASAARAGPTPLVGRLVRFQAAR